MEAEALPIGYPFQTFFCNRFVHFNHILTSENKETLFGLHSSYVYIKQYFFFVFFNKRRILYLISNIIIESNLSKLFSNLVSVQQFLKTGNFKPL